MKLAPLTLLLGLSTFFASAAEPAKRTPLEALKPFNELIGRWRATGAPEGTAAEKQKGIWNEKLAWEWQFKGNDCWLTVEFDKGKHFGEGTLRYLADKDQFQLLVTTPTKETLTFVGPLDKHQLLLERTDEKKQETQRLTIALLHDNRYLYSYWTKPMGRQTFTKVYQVGCTKEGVAFAASGDGPECVVSGGPPTSKVMYKGQTYYVCCSGCRVAFQDDPEKFIKEYEARKAKKK